jgi:hypothetical protein
MGNKKRGRGGVWLSYGWEPFWDRLRKVTIMAETFFSGQTRGHLDYPDRKVYKYMHHLAHLHA